MAILVPAFFIFLAIAGALEWTTDSRDFADWRPSDDGLRRRPER